MSSTYKKKGFTLIELMVVVAIIGILLSITLYSISLARENARDKQRVADISQIELALSIYKEKNREYPTFDDGVKIVPGSALDVALGSLWSGLPDDPKSSDEYQYYYDSDYVCNEASQHVIIISTMEKEDASNFESVCGELDDSETIGGPNSYVVVLDSGANYSQSVYYAEGTYYGQGSYAPVYAQCTPSSNIPGDPGSWYSDWPSSPMDHGQQWRTSSGVWIFTEYHSHTCCDGDVKVRSSGISYPSYPSCN